MLVSRFPYPLEKGDKLRAYHQLSELSKTFDITLVAITDQAVSASQKEKVQAFCSHIEICQINLFTKALQIFICFFNKNPFQTGYFYSYKAQRKINGLIGEFNFDHIYCQLIRTTEYVKNQHHIPKTLDYMDALSAGIQRRVNKQPWYKRWLFRSEAKRLLAYERRIFDYFEHKTIISDQDKRLIQHPDRDKIVCVPNGIDHSFHDRPNVERKYDFVFVGNMSYPPNIDAAHYIAEKILPEFENSTFLISGSSPHPSVQALANNNAAIEMTGWVEDIRESYVSGQIFLAPMMIGTGMQNKLLEAMALGVPCVTTPLANNAINAENGKQIMVGSDSVQIVQAIRKLKKDSSFRNDLAEAGAKFVKEKYNWSTSVSTLLNMLNS